VLLETTMITMVTTNWLMKMLELFLMAQLTTVVQLKDSLISVSLTETLLQYII
tara:strand:+ start:456 stop:614 length:159 start_codon:yes stop_codon:yes gene_type:complete